MLPNIILLQKWGQVFYLFVFFPQFRPHIFYWYRFWIRGIIVMHLINYLRLDELLTIIHWLAVLPLVTDKFALFMGLTHRLPWLLLYGHKAVRLLQEWLGPLLLRSLDSVWAAKNRWLKRVTLNRLLLSDPDLVQFVLEGVKTWLFYEIRRRTLRVLLGGTPIYHCCLCLLDQLIVVPEALWNYWFVQAGHAWGLLFTSVLPPLNLFVEKIVEEIEF